MNPVGSPEWFNERSHTKEMDELNTFIENRREMFIDRFSPEKLSEMNGQELLKSVFSDDPNSMMRWLMFDKDCRWFGAAGKYKYLGIIYQDGNGWKYKEGASSELLSLYEAVKRAETVRDQLVSCINEIENAGLISTVLDYQVLQSRIEKVFFYKFPWALKYYQMFYPQYFPGMYADKTIERCLHILGLPNHGKTSRLINAGEISLFIRKCDVNNIVFNRIYSNMWGWEKDYPPCPNAALNYENSSKPVRSVNMVYYKTSTDSRKKNEREKQAKAIDDSIRTLRLEGAEKEAVVKIRVNQGAFRESLLQRYGKCCLCGIKNPLMLVASHIKPWAVSQPDEKLDPNNGLLLCPNHDRLFDQGLITFDDSGYIMISGHLGELDRVFSNVREGMSIPLTEKNRPYLKFHRDHIFK